MWRWLFLSSVVFASVALADKALDRAREQVQKLQFAQAAKSLNEARAATGLSREDVLTLYELTGVVAGSLGDADGAREAFKTLAMLDPEAKLKGRFAPKVQTPFLEGKALAREAGELDVSLGKVTDADGAISSIELSCPRDVKLAKALVVTLDEDGAPRTQRLDWKPVVQVPVKARSVVVSVKVLSASEWELGRFGPFAVRAKEPVVAEPKPVPPATPPIVEAKPQSGSTIRTLGWTAAGIGVASLATATVFGIRSVTLRSSVENPEVRDSVVVGLTRAEALQRSQDAVTSATVANICFIAGGALVVTGVVFWLLDVSSAPAVSFVPVPGGAMAAFGANF